MNKTELVAAIAKKAGMTKVDSAKAFNALMEVTKEELKKGEKIALIGFGTVFADDLAAPRAVGHPSGVSEINDFFRGKHAHKFLYRAESAQAGIENADRVL